MKYIIIICLLTGAYVLGRINSYQDINDCVDKIHEVENKEKVFAFYEHKTLHFPHFHAYFYMRATECLIKEKL